jgi:hypothetical protein
VSRFDSYVLPVCHGQWLVWTTLDKRVDVARRNMLVLDATAQICGVNLYDYSHRVNSESVSCVRSSNRIASLHFISPCCICDGSYHSQATQTKDKSLRLHSVTDVEVRQHIIGQYYVNWPASNRPHDNQECAQEISFIVCAPIGLPHSNDAVDVPVFKLDLALPFQGGS